MHPLNTLQRRRLLAACLRIERQLKKDRRDKPRDDQERLARFMRGGRPWDVTAL